MVQSVRHRGHRFDTEERLPRRNVDVPLGFRRFALSIGPIPTAAVAATQNVADAREPASTREVAPSVTRQIAADIADAALRTERLDRPNAVATMHNATTIGPPANKVQASKDTVPTHRTVAEGRTTRPTCVLSVRTTEALVGRDISLIRPNGGKEGAAHF